MAYVKPNFGNLQKRAKALGMKITRVTTDEEARQFGGHEYVLTQAHASQSRIDNATCYSLNGIRSEIEGIESVRVQEIPEDAHKAKPTNHLKSNVSTFFISREEVVDAANRLSGAKVANAVSVISAMEKDCYSDHIGEIKNHHKRSMIHQMVDLIAEDIEFSETERVAERGFGIRHETDTHMAGRLVVMRESDYLAVMKVMKKLTR